MDLYEVSVKELQKELKHVLAGLGFERVNIFYDGHVGTPGEDQTIMEVYRVEIWDVSVSFMFAYRTYEMECSRLDVETYAKHLVHVNFLTLLNNRAYRHPATPHVRVFPRSGFKYLHRAFPDRFALM